MQSCLLSPGQESQGTTRPQLHLPEPTGSLRCRGQMLLTLELLTARLVIPQDLLAPTQPCPSCHQRHSPCVYPATTRVPTPSERP